MKKKLEVKKKLEREMAKEKKTLIGANKIKERKWQNNLTKALTIKD